MSLPPIGVDLMGRPIGHAESCVCRECRDADHKRGLLETIARLTRERDELAGEVERYHELRWAAERVVHLEDRPASVTVDPDMLATAWTTLRGTLHRLLPAKPDDVKERQT